MRNYLIKTSKQLNLFNYWLSMPFFAVNIVSLQI